MVQHKQIFGMSNSSAFFVSDQEEPLFLEKIIQLSGKERPVICYIGAANGDSSEKKNKFFALAKRADFEPVILNLFALESDDWTKYFQNVDVIYIDGGSTRNLRALITEWQVDEALNQAYDNGVLITGASAGINILFEWGMTDSVRTKIEPTAGLGILSGSVSVHNDIRKDRVTAFRDFLTSKDSKCPAYAMDDGTALHMVDGKLHQGYALSPSAAIMQYSPKSDSLQQISSTKLGTHITT